MAKQNKGFLERSISQEGTDEEGSDLEELYEKLFAKIGRDFVYKEDLVRVFSLLMNLIDPLGLNPLDFQSDGGARARAAEYKHLLDTGKDGSKIYKDLIDLDD